MKSIFEKEKDVQARLVQEFFDNMFADNDTAQDSEPKTLGVWTDESYQDVVGLADKLLSDYPNSFFVGLGDSPSYLVHAMKLLAEKQNSDVQARHIAFSSGHLFRLITRSPSENLYFNRFPEEWPLHLDKYREYLTTQGLHPEKIMARYNETGTKTIAADYFEKGKSIASFIHIMYIWARECGINDKTFSKVFLPVVFSHFNISPLIKFRDDRFQVRIYHVPVSRGLTNTLSSMASCVNRFVPYYSQFEWGRPPVDPIDTIANVLEIKRGLQDAVEAYPVRQTHTLGNFKSILTKIIG
ncbi:MAG: hypothetical protein WC521_07175 [Bdellovibrionales bacterium]